MSSSYAMRIDANTRKGGFRFLGWTADPQRNVLSEGQDEVRIEPQTMEVLRQLMAAPGVVLSKQELIEGAWQGRAVTDDALTVAIYQLRKTLGDDARRPRFIETIARRGYRFVPPIEPLEKPGATPRTATTHQPAAGIEPEPTGQIKRAHGLWRWALAAVLVASSSAALLNVSTWRSPQSLPADLAIDSLAVLPVLEDDGAARLDLTDSLIAALSPQNKVRIISRTSVDSWVEQRPSTRQMTEHLAVDALLDVVLETGPKAWTIEGRVVDDASRLLWQGSHSMPPPSDNGRELASRLAEVLISDLIGESAGSSTLPVAKSPEADAAFQRGYFHIMRLTGTDVLKAREHFLEAIEIEPSYAPAHAGLASAYARLLPAVEDPVKRRDWTDAARRAAETAAALAPELAASQIALGHVALTVDWRPKEAHRRLVRALELDPSNPHGHQTLGWVLTVLGQGAGAEAAARRAVALDPANPVRYLELAFVLNYVGRTRLAIRELEKALDLDPRFYEAQCLLAYSLLWVGEDEEFYPRLRAALLGQGLATDEIDALDAAWDRAGLDGLRRRFLEWPDSMLGAMNRAHQLAAVGDHDSALSILEESLAQDHSFLIWVGVHPGFRPLTEEPRFQELLRRIEARQS